jgi:hypothetical protein
MDRGERRRRTERIAKRGLNFWLSFDYNTYTRSLGEFFKRKALACGCRRVQRGLSPKIPGSLCHAGDFHGGYHPCVRERIDGKRLTQAWLAILRGGTEGVDVEL